MAPGARPLPGHGLRDQRLLPADWLKQMEADGGSFLLKLGRPPPP